VEKSVKLLGYSRKDEPSAVARLDVLIGSTWSLICAGYALYLVDEARNPKGHDLVDPETQRLHFADHPDARRYDLHRLAGRRRTRQMCSCMCQPSRVMTTHAPYNGGAAALVNLLGGRISYQPSTP